MSSSLRIAVLVCDTPVQPVLEKYGDYYAIFQGLLKQGFQDLELPEELDVQFSGYHVVENPQFPELHDYDAVLMTGSKHDAWSNADWIVNLTSYVKKAFEAKKPIVGICFGHQILARALGAKVGRNETGWELSVEGLDLTDEGKELFGKDKLSIQQMHRDIVFHVPAGCSNLATSPICGVQGIYMPQRALSVQGHPEFHEGIMTPLLELRHQSGLFNDQLYKDGLSRAGNPHDGRLIAKTMVKFIVEAQSSKS
ncbi:hypothetical protein PENANT_c009G07360 [Penicillium antarcticum]|uniref:Glutamine amidotransferase domain-containing protein n=1 Tax=Penicillium antarcticum TaxID=416450 RepID=A0A1V6QAA3_9EURO|nr:uncharacterized protein N7508_006362 [Penicillium antarcticum]KAJ5301499.1 hypothetical protein N7508_006362 [Penicillium antarcticum]OQD85776.1 hypothetical protein PENANT_c009G07360 [Penicillium antarcticum]